ncbi:MAG: hypothetical protein ACE5RI_09780 [Candidatus Nitrosomaritimum yanchengensis]
MSHSEIWFIVVSLLDKTWVLTKNLGDEDHYEIIAVHACVAFFTGATIVPIQDIQKYLDDENLLNKDYLSLIQDEYQRKGLS